ncbi:MAG: 30S ribosomal protein S12 methylthiotransferase RimO, partial [Candidatus Aminicenantes bacterium]
MEKVALITLGCAKNLVDSEVMAGYLHQAGYDLVAHPEEADTVIINTCGFIQPAKEETHQTFIEAVDLKRKKKIKKTVAVGCYVERDERFLREKFPEIDVWMGVNDFAHIVQAMEGKPFTPSSQCFLYHHGSPRLLSTPPAWAYVKISEGCSHQCSFCAIPLIKGSYRSREISSISAEVRNLASRGVKEINLISQDSTYYGRDKGLQEGLTLLLKELLKVKGIEWIRVLYGYPEEISDPLLEVMQEKKICSYLDLPFQHSDPRIINNMKRGMDGKRALKLIQKIRKKIPDVALRTSLVVGFPGEGKKEFDNLKNFVQQARFDHLGVFTYSQEQGTTCFELGDPVKESVKKRRKEKIMDIQAEISFENNNKRLHKTIDALVEGTLKDDSSQLVGRARFQAPEVDGIIFLNSSYPLSEVVNTIQKVEITAHHIYDLYGRI